MRNNFEPLADHQAAKKAWSHIDYLCALAEGRLLFAATEPLS